MPNESHEALEAFRDSARDYLGRANQRARVRDLRDQPDNTCGYDRKVWRDIAEAGWLSILIGEEDGGLGLGIAEVAAIAEIAGETLLPEPLVGSGVQAVALLCAVPASALKSQLLEQIASGELIAAVAWQTRPGQLQAGEGAALSVTRENDSIMLNGAVQHVSAGAGADGWIVYAAQNGEAQLFWVAKDTAGISVTDVERIDGSRMATLTFKETSVAGDAVLASGEQANAALDAANDIARLAQSAELLGIARRTLELTLDYLKTRVQFGKPIGSFQALQHRMVDAYIQTELAGAGLAVALADASAAGQLGSLDAAGRKQLAIAASRAKNRCAQAATHVTQLALQMYGAIGFTDECDIGLYYKRALQLASWLGNGAAHRQRYFALNADAAVADEKETGSTAAPAEFPRDADWDAMPEQDFRQLLRAFFASNYPQRLRNLPRRQHWDEIKEWYFTLSKQGWIAPAWPKKFGGMGLGTDKLLAFIEEQEKYGVARMVDAGLTMAGPVLIRYGTPEQQQYYLPKILSGEHVWSQGYSEPGAGSDLASLRTEAIADGDDFIVTGQKIWTTMAQDSTHIFMLVRTDKSAKPQAGISFLLVDINSPGVTVRVIRDIVGHEHFCEVFFDKVRVPQSNLVGELNQGWGIAKALLGFERIFLGNPRQSQNALAHLHEMAKARSLFDDPVFVANYAKLQLDVEDLTAIYAQFAEIVKRGETLPASVSLLKIWATETYRNIGLLLAEAGQESGGDFPVEGLNGATDNLLTALINSASATIYGGSNEIQRNIIAKAVLNLP